MPRQYAQDDRGFAAIAGIPPFPSVSVLYDISLDLPRRWLLFVRESHRQGRRSTEKLMLEAPPKSSVVEALGPRLRRQRRRLGLTLDELATRTGISKPYLSLIETGRVAHPAAGE